MYLHKSEIHKYRQVLKKLRFKSSWIYHMTKLIKTNQTWTNTNLIIQSQWLKNYTDAYDIHFSKTKILENLKFYLRKLESHQVPQYKAHLFY